MNNKPITRLFPWFPGLLICFLLVFMSMHASIAVQGDGDAMFHMELAADGGYPGVGYPSAEVLNSVLYYEKSIKMIVNLYEH